MEGSPYEVLFVLTYQFRSCKLAKIAGRTRVLQKLSVEECRRAFEQLASDGCVAEDVVVAAEEQEAEVGDDEELIDASVAPVAKEKDIGVELGNVLRRSELNLNEEVIAEISELVGVVPDNNDAATLDLVALFNFVYN